MPNTNAPRGFRVVNSNAGAPFSGALTEYRIASGLATTICEGDLVVQLSTGYITRAAAGNTAGTGLVLGVFKGVRYTGLDGTPKVDNKWVSGTATLGSGDAFALIVDDPNVVVECKFVGANSPTNANVGETYDIVDAAGNTSTGLSGQGVDSTSNLTTIQKLRFLGFVARPDNDVSSGNTQYATGRFAFIAHTMRTQAGV